MAQPSNIAMTVDVVCRARAEGTEARDRAGD